MWLSTTPFRFALNTFLLPLPLVVWAGPSPSDLGLGQTLPDGPGQVILGLRSFGCITEFGEMTKLDRLRSWRMAVTKK